LTPRTSSEFPHRLAQIETLQYYCPTQIHA
jgi:hypothetical protein